MSKVKSPQEVEEDLGNQISALEQKIKTKEELTSGQPANVRNIELGQMRRDLQDLKDRKTLVWEKIRREGEKAVELTK